MTKKSKGMGDFMEKEIMVDIKNVSKSYEHASGKFRVLDNVSLRIDKGEFVGIVGDSGSGKTTLLNLIGGMDRPSSGQITVAGDVISGFDDTALTRYRRKRVGFIFQDYNLIEELTVYENILLPLQLNKKPCDEAHIDKLLHLLRLDEKKNAFPMQLSGGEAQRAAILRSLISEPDIILADEPTGNLDSKNTQAVVALLHQFSMRMNCTILFVTHNIALTKQCSRVICVQDKKLMAHAPETQD